MVQEPNYRGQAEREERRCGQSFLAAIEAVYSTYCSKAETDQTKGSSKICRKSVIPAALNVLILPIWVMALAELVGIPIAWFKVRGKSEWQDRPPDIRRIDVLARFISPVTGFAGLWSVVVGVAILIGAAVS